MLEVVIIVEYILQSALTKKSQKRSNEALLK